MAVLASVCLERNCGWSARMRTVFPDASAGLFPCLALPLRSSDVGQTIDGGEQIHLDGAVRLGQALASVVTSFCCDKKSAGLLHSDSMVCGGR